MSAVAEEREERESRANEKKKKKRKMERRRRRRKKLLIQHIHTLGREFFFLSSFFLLHIIYKCDII
jgi:hypothetical protein